MNSYNWHNFQNFGYISYDFTDDQLLPIKTEINEIKSKFDLAQKANNNLAGHIAKEYYLKKSFQYANDLMYPFIKAYDEQFNYVNHIDVLNKPCELVLDLLWVNFQQKHEFNPTHNHNGIMSFVIWIDIPYDLKQEHTIYPELLKNDRVNCTSNFYFEYTDIFGRIRQNYLPVDKSYENRMIIFPACVNHGVCPFYTSDDYRISVAGNFKFDIK